MNELFKVATTESCFIFDNKLFKQIDGVAIGSPLSLTMADSLFCHYEKTWPNECPQFKPTVYKLLFCLNLKKI